MVEFSNIYVSPWYVRFDANQVRTNGINIASAAAGTSPGNGFVDLPAPVDYVTNNWTLEGGYATKEGNFSVNVLRSTFTNDNQTLRWTNPFFGSTGRSAGATSSTTTFLPPDNELWKVSANGALRTLPWGSTLAGRVTYSELTNNVGVLGTMLSGTAAAGAYASTSPNNNNFDGKIKNTTVTVSLASNPARAVDTKLYYNYYDKKNESTQVTFANCGVATAPPFTSCTNELFSYTRNNAGAEVGYRFAGANRLVGVIDYNYQTQERVDYPNTTQWTYGVEWRNNSLDWLGSRLGLSYIQRRSDFELGQRRGERERSAVPRALRRALRPVQPRPDPAEARPRFEPGAVSSISGSRATGSGTTTRTTTSGSDPLLGRKYDQRQEYYASVSCGDPNMFRVTFFGDIEFIQYDSYHRNISDLTAAQRTPLSTIPTRLSDPGRPVRAGDRRELQLQLERDQQGHELGARPWLATGRRRTG